MKFSQRKVISTLNSVLPLSTRLGVFGNPSASDLPPGYSVRPEFVKDVHQDWIVNFLLSLDLGIKAMEQHQKTLPLFGSSMYQPGLLESVCSMTRRFFFCRNGDGGE